MRLVGVERERERELGDTSPRREIGKGHITLGERILWGVYDSATGMGF